MAAFKRLLSGVFRQRVRGALGRHHDRPTVAQLPSTVASLRPGEEGVDIHIALREIRHRRTLPFDLGIAKPQHARNFARAMLGSRAMQRTRARFRPPGQTKDDGYGGR